MNIYEKLQKARNELKDMKLKKSGENKFAKYTYYELEDFLPAIQNLCEKHKLVAAISFTYEYATLTLVDSEKPEDKICFTSPMVESEMKGMTNIQTLGATQTYQRRYLYMTAFEIVEVDGTDRVSEDISLHRIEKIKQRIEQTITAKLANGMTKENILSSLKLTAKQFDTLLGYCDSISNFEHALKKL